jgi:spermidine synthase
MRRLLLPVFFLSGATSLVYQTLWERALHLLLGTSGVALATVLAAFMAGLGLGGYLGGRWAPARPLRAYGWLELGIGLYALAFPLLLAAAEPAYLLLHRGPLAPLAPGLELLFAAALLLPPTVAMGTTLPLLSRVVVDRIGTASERMSELYAANTLGAVAGTFVAGLVLLPTVGFTTTNRVAAAGNLLVALLALALDPRFPALVPTDDLDFEDRPPSAPARAGLVVVFLCGVAGLASEVLWTRMVALMLGATTYAFTAMLLAVLFGIAFGGRIGGTLADEALRFGGMAATRVGLARVCLLLAVTSFALPFLWPWLPYVFVGVFDLFDGRENPLAVFLGSFTASTLALLLPAVLMGAAFPYAVRVVTGDSGEASPVVGQVYAANTFGGVLGALLAAFVGIPALGLRGVAGATTVVYALAAVAAAPRARGHAALGVVLAVVPFLVTAPWDPLWMNGGLYQYVAFFSDHSPEGLAHFTSGDQELLYVQEGRSSVVTVGKNHETSNLWLANNGKVDASSEGDLPTQILVSLLGAQFVEHPDEVLVVGLASGISAGAVTLLPEVRHIEVVELEPAILGAARLFAPYNFGLLEDPRVELVWNDGRNHVLRAPEGTWDLVVNEPSNPYLSGVSNLFTREFWEVGRTRLAPGGVWAQWVQLYGMGPDELDGLIRTFAEVYPHVAVYEVLRGADLVLLGSDHPLVPTEEAAARLFAAPRAAEALRKIELTRPLDVVALHAFDRDQALAFAGDAEPVTDDNLRVEYAAPLWLHTDIAVENWNRLRDAAHVRWSAVGDDPLRWLDLAHAYGSVGDGRRAKLVRARAFAWLPPGSPLQQEVLEQLRGGE